MPTLEEKLFINNDHNMDEGFENMVSLGRIFVEKILRTVAWSFIAFLYVGCAYQELQLRESLRKNPKLVFDVIEENPEQFMEVVNRAEQNAQSRQREGQARAMRAQQEDNMKNPLKPALSDGTRLEGKGHEKLVLVEYADFQCPACGMAYEALEEFKEKHKGQYQFHFKNMPLSFHRMALPAAKLFVAIQTQSQEKALNFYKKIFREQRRLGDEDFLLSATKSVGADLVKVKALAESESVKKRIAEDMKEFERMGFTGTPVVIINGVALHGAQPLDELERVASRLVSRESP